MPFSEGVRSEDELDPNFWVDTDPPLQISVPLDSLASRPPPPVWGGLHHQLALAADSIAARKRAGRPRGTEPRADVDPLAPGSLAEVVLKRIRQSAPETVPATELWHWVHLHHPSYSRSAFQMCLARLVRLNLILPIVGRSNRRLYRAVPQ